jgi:hypothetical protein
MNWIKMNKTKPAIERRVILTDGKHIWIGSVNMYGINYEGRAVFVYKSDNSDKKININQVTHWANLPDIPLYPGHQYEIPFPEAGEDEHQINQG